MPFPRPKKVYTEAELYEYAVGALGRRMRTVAELKRLLGNKVEAETEFGQTLVEIDHPAAKRSGISERREICRRLFLSSPRQREIRTHARGHRPEIKGVHGEVIEKAVSGRYDEVSEEKQARDYLRRKRMQQTEGPEAGRPNFPATDARRIPLEDDLHDPEEVGRGRGNAESAGGRIGRHRTRCITI